MSIDLTQALSQAFRSDQTPPFSEMLGHLFGNSNPDTRASVLNTLMSNLEPQALAGILQRHGSDVAPEGQVTPDQAGQVPQSAVKEIAEEAQKKDPSIMDRISEIYAQHPTLIQSLGVLAMGMIYQHQTKK